MSAFQRCSGLFILLVLFTSNLAAYGFREGSPLPVWISAQTATQTVFASLPTPIPPVTPTPVVDATAVFSKGKPVSSASTDKKEPLTLSANFTLWLSPAVPPSLREELSLINGLSLSSAPSAADAQLRQSVWRNQSCGDAIRYTYVLVAPFPTVLDRISWTELRSVWRGETSYFFGDSPIFMTESTRQAMIELLGAPAAGKVRVADQDVLLDEAWQSMPAWGVIPFEELTPRWKVLEVEQQSPLQPDFDPDQYPLTLAFEFTPVDESRALPALGELKASLPCRNYDRSLRTLLTLTGTTALVRMTAVRMEEKGINYPAERIRDWLTGSDITHVSNEVAFTPACPSAVPVRKELRFCSSPAYYDLLPFAGVDVVELTGNHLTDYGVEAFSYTLQLYQQRGMPYYGGGRDLIEAGEDLFVTHNSNHLVFMGCNSVGPPDVLADKKRPGANPCDLDEMEKRIIMYRQAGYLPVVTFQHFEFGQFLNYQPQSAQRVDLQRIARAGAAVVSGSQAHYPQTMTLIDDAFVHYGLGNLFFDQMEEPSRNVFVDRHIFYNGRHINTQLLTARLEDYAQLRPLSVSQRRIFLEAVFDQCAW